MGTANPNAATAFRRGLAIAVLAAATALAGCGDGGLRRPLADIGGSEPQADVGSPAPQPVAQAAPTSDVGVSTTSESSYGYVPYVPNPVSLGESDAMPGGELACRDSLRRLGVAYRELPPIDNGGVCRIDHPISVTGLPGGIRLYPAATLNCAMAERFASWVKRDLSPAVRVRYLSGIESIHQLSSYSCRTMDSIPGAKMSEHSKGNAIDVGSITLRSGRTLDVTRPGFFAFRQRSLLNTVRADACDYFTTVLGPGDPYHGNHFHFDLMQRRGRRICE
jgi:hypothetical protein